MKTSISEKKYNNLCIYPIYRGEIWWGGVDVSRYAEVYAGIDFDKYSNDELDEFGKKLVRAYMIQLSFAKIGSSGSKVKIREFDFSVGNISKLSDACKEIVMGSYYVTREKYVMSLCNYLEEVSTYSENTSRNSVKRGLYNSVLKLLIELQSTLNNKQGFSFWEM